MPSIKRSNAETRRGQVLEAAAECFRRDGFDGASMAEISKQAGMSVGHIYHYFENKNAIIAAIIDQEFEEILDLFEEIAREPDILNAMVARADEGFLSRTDGRTATLFLEIMAQAARDPALAEKVIATDKILRQKIRGLALQGRRAAGHPDPQAEEEREFAADLEMIATLFEGLSIRIVRNPHLDREAMLASLRRVMRSLLRA